MVDVHRDEQKFIRLHKTISVFLLSMAGLKSPVSQGLFNMSEVVVVIVVTKIGLKYNDTIYTHFSVTKALIIIMIINDKGKNSV